MGFQGSRVGKPHRAKVHRPCTCYTITDTDRGPAKQTWIAFLIPLFPIPTRPTPISPISRAPPMLAKLKKQENLNIKGNQQIIALILPSSSLKILIGAHIVYSIYRQNCIYIIIFVLNN